MTSALLAGLLLGPDPVARVLGIFGQSALKPAKVERLRDGGLAASGRGWSLVLDSQGRPLSFVKSTSPSKGSIRMPDIHALNQKAAALGELLLPGQWAPADERLLNKSLVQGINVYAYVPLVNKVPVTRPVILVKAAMMGTQIEGWQWIPWKRPDKMPPVGSRAFYGGRLVNGKELYEMWMRGLSKRPGKGGWLTRVSYSELMSAARMWWTGGEPYTLLWQIDEGKLAGLQPRKRSSSPGRPQPSRGRR